MLKILTMIFTGIIVSFYYFPFEFSFLPGLNTKMGLAVVGLLLALLNLIRKREVQFPPNLVRIEAFAVLVSVVGITSVVINNTSDYVYATYFASMTVWLSGAYTVCSLIKRVHGSLTVENVTLYLASVCAFQCMFALIIDANIVVKKFIDLYIIQGQAFLTEVERLYGVGASLDTAGVRFSICLILISFILNRCKDKMGNVQILIMVLLYVWIAIVGNMIARTTIVGVALSLFSVMFLFRPMSVNRSFFRIARVVLLILLVTIPLCIYLYNNSTQFYQLSRFAFEGFFNLAETGEWEIGSNETLKTMIIFPDNLKTWIIGDAYFTNPYGLDPYYVGPFIGGYYMGTDIGYCRFIFYFGIVGLCAFSTFIIYVAKECILLLPTYRNLILIILLLGFVIWMKVATDVFLVFALLLCIGNMQDAPQQHETES